MQSVFILVYAIFKGVVNKSPTRKKTRQPVS